MVELAHTAGSVVLEGLRRRAHAAEDESATAAIPPRSAAGSRASRVPEPRNGSPSSMIGLGRSGNALDLERDALRGEAAAVVAAFAVRSALAGVLLSRERPGWSVASRPLFLARHSDAVCSSPLVIVPGVDREPPSAGGAEQRPATGPPAPKRRVETLPVEVLRMATLSDHLSAACGAPSSRSRSRAPTAPGDRRPPARRPRGRSGRSRSRRP